MVVVVAVWMVRPQNAPKDPYYMQLQNVERVGNVNAMVNVGDFGKLDPVTQCVYT